jgi:hypothetical protein
MPTKQTGDIATATADSVDDSYSRYLRLILIMLARYSPRLTTARRVIFRSPEESILLMPLYSSEGEKKTSLSEWPTLVFYDRKPRPDELSNFVVIMNDVFGFHNICGSPEQGERLRNHLSLFSRISGDTPKGGTCFLKGSFEAHRYELLIQSLIVVGHSCGRCRGYNISISHPLRRETGESLCGLCDKEAKRPCLICDGLCKRRQCPFEYTIKLCNSKRLCRFCWWPASFHANYPHVCEVDCKLFSLRLFFFTLYRNEANKDSLIRDLLISKIYEPIVMFDLFIIFIALSPQNI